MQQLPTVGQVVNYLKQYPSNIRVALTEEQSDGLGPFEVLVLEYLPGLNRKETTASAAPQSDQES